MLEPAQLHKEELEKCFWNSAYDIENIYYSGWTGDRMPDLPDNNYDCHHFVSLDYGGNVIGYISYSVNWAAMSASNFGIISFGKSSLLFAKDIYQVICDLFDKYNMNRLEWCCFADNPAIRSYRNFIKKHGGRECGYYRQVTKLMDGKLHDKVDFEILESEFKR